MTIQTESIPAAPKQRKAQFITAAVGVVLALAVAAGIGAWQVSRHGSASVATPQAASRPAPATAQSAAGRDIDTALTYYLAGPTWYVVGSAAQAEQVGDVLSYRNKTFLLEGTPLPDAQVIVVDSALAEQQIRFAAADEHAVRAAEGAPALRIIDLRAGGDRAGCRLGALGPAC